VTVRKSESAMLPFLQQKIAARKLLVYADQTSQHPTNAAELTNATGKTLDGGPITVFDGGAYGGEALVETLKTGDKRFISYAVDLGRASRRSSIPGGCGARDPSSARILTARTAAVETKRTRSQCRSEAQDADHRASRAPWLSAIGAQAGGDYRLGVALRSEARAGRDGEISGDEERVYDQTFGITNLTPDVLLSYVQTVAERRGAKTVAADCEPEEPDRRGDGDLGALKARPTRWFAIRSGRGRTS